MGILRKIWSFIKLVWRYVLPVILMVAGWLGYSKTRSTKPEFQDKERKLSEKDEDLVDSISRSKEEAERIKKEIEASDERIASLEKQLDEGPEEEELDREELRNKIRNRYKN